MSSFIPGLGMIGAISALPKLPSLKPAEEQGGFSGVFSNALDHVNELSSGAEQKVSNLLTGGNEDMSTVMIAVEKADVAFQLMMQVRNKIVTAYQDIERMQF